jgi:hypothetical protein
LRLAKQEFHADAVVPIAEEELPAVEDCENFRDPLDTRHSVAARVVLRGYATRVVVRKAGKGRVLSLPKDLLRATAVESAVAAVPLPDLPEF